MTRFLRPMRSVCVCLAVLGLWWETAWGQDQAKPPAPGERSSGVNPHPRAKEFPGEVPPEVPRVSQTIEVNPQVRGWHSTGLYAAPGETITVTVPRDATDKGFRLRIGCHSDRLRDSKRREPAITTSSPRSR